MTKAGCGIPLARYFYKPQKLLTIDPTNADSVALKKETGELSQTILGEAERG